MLIIFDEGKYEVLDLLEVFVDFFKFKDEKKYMDCFKEVCNKFYYRDVMVVLVGKLKGFDVVVFV